MIINGYAALRSRRYGTHKMQRLRQRCFHVSGGVPELRLSDSGSASAVAESHRFGLPTLRFALRRQGQRTSGHWRGVHCHHLVLPVHHSRHHLLHLHGVSAVLFRLWTQSMTVPPNHALQRTAASRRSCNRRASWPPSLSLGRYAQKYLKGYKCLE